MEGILICYLSGIRISSRSSDIIRVSSRYTTRDAFHESPLAKVAAHSRWWLGQELLGGIGVGDCSDNVSSASVLCLPSILQIRFPSLLLDSLRRLYILLDHHLVLRFLLCILLLPTVSASVFTSSSIRCVVLLLPRLVSSLLFSSFLISSLLRYLFSFLLLLFIFSSLLFASVLLSSTLSVSYKSSSTTSSSTSSSARVWRVATA